MSVLVKGMEMPESCITCPLCECRNECAYCEVGDKYLSWDWDERLRSSRNDHCPLTEVPPHGRLIDADAMNEKYGDWYTEEGTEEGFIGALKYLIAEQPIIIEAEGT